MRHVNLKIKKPWYICPCWTKEGEKSTCTLLEGQAYEFWYEKPSIEGFSILRRDYNDGTILRIEVIDEFVEIEDYHE